MRPVYSDTTEMYGEYYQSDSIAADRTPAWRAIASGILDRFSGFADLLDVGCGAGPLLGAMRAHDPGLDLWGIEGSIKAVEKSDERILLWDLRVPLTILREFDLVTCFDVAEHVGAAEALVETLTSCASTRILFGAAPPGQDGHGHIDLREPAEWDVMFAARGFLYDAAETRALKEAIASRPEHNMIWWVEKNIRVYERSIFTRHPEEEGA